MREGRKTEEQIPTEYFSVQAAGSDKEANSSQVYRLLDWLDECSR